MQARGLNVAAVPTTLPIVAVGTSDLFIGLLTANLARGHALVEATLLARTIAESKHEM